MPAKESLQRMVGWYKSKILKQVTTLFSAYTHILYLDADAWSN